MRKPANPGVCQRRSRRALAGSRLLRAALVVLTTSWTGSALAQEPALNRIADGDFDSGFISLKLPPEAPFPMFWGGWAARGERTPLLIEGVGPDGGQALRLVASSADPVQVMQDLPLETRGYGVRLSFWIEEGAQSIRLLRRGDDGQPDGGSPAFEVTIARDTMRFTTPEGSWQIDVAVAAGTWHVLSVFADPRTGAQSVRFDGAPLIALPGVASGGASTLMIGGAGGVSGVFRYDAVSVVSLIDMELAAVRADAERLQGPEREAVLDRLAVAATALGRGSQILAVSELDVARRMLGAGTPEQDNLRRALDDLVELVNRGREGLGTTPQRGAGF